MWRKHLADRVANCSFPCIVAIFWSWTLRQLIRASNQRPAMRVGLKWASSVFVARCPMADGRTLLSSDVWSAHEMHRESDMAICQIFALRRHAAHAGGDAPCAVGPRGKSRQFSGHGLSGKKEIGWRCKRDPENQAPQAYDSGPPGAIVALLLQLPQRFQRQREWYELNPPLLAPGNEGE